MLGDVGRVEEREQWFKSLEIRIRALGCFVCSLLTVELMISQAASAEQREAHTQLPRGRVRIPSVDSLSL